MSKYFRYFLLAAFSLGAFSALHADEQKKEEVKEAKETAKVVVEEAAASTAQAE